jgi:hypothetical protein
MRLVTARKAVIGVDAVWLVAQMPSQPFDLALVD